jgi:hypothetical protein
MQVQMRSRRLDWTVDVIIDINGSLKMTPEKYSQRCDDFLGS